MSVVSTYFFISQAHVFRYASGPEPDCASISSNVVIDISGGATTGGWPAANGATAPEAADATRAVDKPEAADAPEAADTPGAAFPAPLAEPTRVFLSGGDAITSGTMEDRKKLIQTT